MNCPNCNFEIESGNLCPQCGMDAVLFSKTYNVSDILYNRALDALTIQDLSGAIDCLKKSIEFNKNNFLSRNLLGLVYYEIGHLGDACIHWVISASMLREGNPAVRYMQEVQEYGRENLEKLNDSVIMFNQALEYIKQKSDDMAIIQLKKAVEINPKFIDAMNLLTFCYLIQKNKAKALELVEKVLAMDINNKIALNYYKEIFPSISKTDLRNPKSNPDEPQTPKSPFSKLIPEDKRMFMNTFHLPEALFFLAGLVIAFALLFILIVPGITQAKDKELEELKTTTAAAEQSYKDTISRNQEAIKNLEEENRRLTDENGRASGQIQVQEKIQRIASAEALLQQSNYEEAATIIYSIDVSDLSSDMVNRVNAIKETAYPAAAQAMFNEAVTKYGEGDYENSKALLEKAAVFEEFNPQNVDGIFYYLGLNAYAMNDLETARRYFQRVIDDYPNSENVSKAQSHLDGM